MNRFSVAIVFVIFSFFNVAQAASYSLVKGVGYKVEPLYGYETIYRINPTPHTKTRSMYGVRLSAGVDLLSAEAEYLKSSDTENYQTAPEKIYSDDEKYKLGIRSIFRFSEYFSSSLRLGGQATKSTTEETSGGVIEREEYPVKYHPYAGASIGIHLGPISINLGSTVVFKDNKDMKKNDIQNSASFAFSVGY